MTKIAKYKPAGTSATTPIEETARKQVMVDSKGRTEKTRHKTYVFYIGGAGDKRAFVPYTDPWTGPYGNALDVRLYVDEQINKLGLKDWYQPDYLGYYEIFGEENIRTNVQSKIQDKSAPIIIIGHSLGGWNGAHLSGWLNNAGYRIEMLITLDPVGEGFLVESTADIPHQRPKPASRFWINIRAATQKKKAFDDWIADFGEQWNVKKGPHINVVVDAHHASAKRMFLMPLDKQKFTAADYVLASIRRSAS